MENSTVDEVKQSVEQSVSQSSPKSPLELIVEEWERDAPIDALDIANKTLSTPILHSKYLRMLASWKTKRSKLSAKLAEVRRFKTRYYNGELTREELQGANLPQYQYKRPLKVELDSMLAADPDVSKVQVQIEAVDTIIYVLERIMEQIKSRDFTISNYIKTQAYTRGETF